MVHVVSLVEAVKWQLLTEANSQMRIYYNTLIKLRYIRLCTLLDVVCIAIHGSFFKMGANGGVITS